MLPPALRHRPSRAPWGRPTRGKTAPNRLRALDALAALWDPALLARADDAWWVDLGYGADPGTTLESAARLRRINPALPVLGVEIDRARVEAALPCADALTAFRHGGFNLPLAPGERVRMIRAMNVLRQYDAAAAEEALAALSAQLEPGGLLLEGTSDPAGRLWTANVVRRPAAGGPARAEALVLGARGAFAPEDLRAVLPKRYIHRVVPGEAVHDLLAAWAEAWRATQPEAVWGRTRHATAAARRLRAAGWAVDPRRRWLRRGMLVWRPDRDGAPLGVGGRAATL